MNVFDRILNKEVHFSKIENPVILGRYYFTSNYSDYLNNDRKIKYQDFLVPSLDLEGLFSSKLEKIPLLFQDNHLLEKSLNSLVTNALVEVTKEFNLCINLSELNSLNLFLRNFDPELEISELENYIKVNLKHIEEVCQYPSYYLKREITKLNISRAKRIPIKAINYLAAHTEDWSRRRISCVEPSKILSEIIEYDLEIYENKVTSILIDKLILYFKKRKSELTLLDNFIIHIESIIELRKTNKVGEKKYWYKKLNKDYETLGSAINSSTKNRNKINLLKEYIDSIEIRLGNLKKSKVYKSTKKSKKLIGSSTNIKSTNLFDNHLHYRHIKILWDKFSNRDSLINTNQTSENRIIIKSYIDYTWILLVRSLFQIGFNEDKRLTESSYCFANKKLPFIEIKINKNINQNIEVLVGEEKIIFIPIPSTKNIEEFFPPEQKNVFYLTLAKINKRADNIEISPTEINSQAQITKIVFKNLLSEYLTFYSFNLNSFVISKFHILSDWLKINESLVLNKGKNGKIDFWLKRKLNKQELNLIIDVINEQKSFLNVRLDIRTKELKELEKLQNELIISSTIHFEKFETCITCSNTDNSSVVTNHNSGFIYKCSNKDCGVEYGSNKAGIYYKTPDYEQIITKLGCENGQINELEILNSFGHENI